RAPRATPRRKPASKLLQAPFTHDNKETSMADYVLTPSPVSAVPVAGGGLFPVRRVYCVGRNYAEHAKEMGFTGREDPFFFCKPADAVVPVADGATGTIPYPPRTNNLHYEMELVVAIGKGGRDIPVE